jgi:SAM-dependent methyltransferase
MKLNLGCGQNKLAGYVNVDKYAACEPDRIADLEVIPWPFADGSADEIMMTHVLEHLGRDTDVFLSIIKEIHRVLKPGAKLHIRVPHPRSEGYLGDPTHVRPISPVIMSLFSKRNNREWKEKGYPNTPLGLYLDVDLEVISTTLQLTPRWLERHQREQMTLEEITIAIELYHNVVDEIQMVVEKVSA